MTSRPPWTVVAYAAKIAAILVAVLLLDPGNTAVLLVVLVLAVLVVGIWRRLAPPWIAAVAGETALFVSELLTERRPWLLALALVGAALLIAPPTRRWMLPRGRAEDLTRPD